MYTTGPREPAIRDPIFWFRATAGVGVLACGVLLTAVPPDSRPARLGLLYLPLARGKTTADPPAARLRLRPLA